MPKSSWNDKAVARNAQVAAIGKYFHLAVFNNMRGPGMRNRVTTWSDGRK